MITRDQCGESAGRLAPALKRPAVGGTAAAPRRRTRASVVTAVAVSALTGLAAAGPTTGATASAVPQNPATVSAVPIPAGQVEAAIAQLDTIAPAMLQRSGVPGMSVAVVHDDELVYAKGFGVRDLRTGVPVDADTVFQLASVSKAVGATVVARSVTQGKVSWDDPIQKSLPWFRLQDPAASRQVTVADMYTHHSGPSGQATDALESLGFNRTEILKRMRFEPLAPFRTVHRYSNFGLTTGAEAVAQSVKTDWATLSQRNLYGPLGMTSTSSRYRDFRARSNRATLHNKTNAGWKAIQHRRPDAQSPAGGVSSSATDMAKWLRLHLADGVYDGKRLIGQDALMRMRTPRSLSGAPSSPDARSTHYGLGMNVAIDATGRVRYAHSGAFSQGAGTRFVMLPSEKLGIVILTNGEPGGLPEALGDSFMDLVTRGHVERDWFGSYSTMMAGIMANPSVLEGRKRPAAPKPSRSRSAYTGTYRTDFYGTMTVKTTGSGLTMRLGPNRKAFRLTHWSGDRWSYRTETDFGSMINEVRFAGRKDGRARTVTVEDLNVDGVGVFRRR